MRKQKKLENGKNKKDKKRKERENVIKILLSKGRI